MKKIISNSSVYIKESKVAGAGRGVFASRDIKRGETIETCPVIEIPPYDMANVNESILVTYFFFCGKKKERTFISLGFGSLYNHSYKPNAMYTIRYKEKTMRVVALAHIKKNTEITFNYKSGNSKNNNPLWFEM